MASTGDLLRGEAVRVALEAVGSYFVVEAFVKVQVDLLSPHLLSLEALEGHRLVET